MTEFIGRKPYCGYTEGQVSGSLCRRSFLIEWYEHIKNNERMPADKSNPRLPGSFGWLNGTQFLGALNDNLFRYFLLFSLIVIQGEDVADGIAYKAGLVFALPFLLFSPLAGALADRFEKAKIIVATKLSEIVFMGAGVAAFAYGQAWTLYLVLFFMGMQSAFFGPSKLGIVPELVGNTRLSRANGYLNAVTYIAIIFGTASASWLAHRLDDNYVAASSICLGVAVVGFLVSLWIPKTGAARPLAKPNLFFLRDIWRTLVFVAKDGFLLLALIASAYFMFVAAFVQLNLIPYGIEALGLDKHSSGYLFPFMGFGIGVGSVLAGRLSGRNVELGLMPLGSLGLTVCLLCLAGVPESLGGVRFVMVFTGISAGLFIVPLASFIQSRTPRGRLGEVLAASAWLIWVGFILGAAALGLFSKVELPAHHGFFVFSLLTLVLTVVAFRVLPDFFLRFVAASITRTFYQVRTRGLQHVPADGPALLVANHVTWADAALMVATMSRRIKFLMSREHYESMTRIRWLLDLSGVIPVSEHDKRSSIENALSAARDKLEEGCIVCIFAEGSLTRTGMMQKFKTGFSRILKGTDYPLIPVYLGGLWGSVFSYAHKGRILSRFPVKIPYPVTIVFGEPMFPDSDRLQVRQRVQELSCKYKADQQFTCAPMPELALRSARKHWREPGWHDTSGKSFTFGEMAVAGLALRRVLQRTLDDRPYIGLALPASVGGCLANYAVALLGRVPVNLNISAGGEAISSMIEQIECTTVVTAKPIYEKLDGITWPKNVLFLEDLLSTIGSADKIAGFVAGRLLPVRWVVSRRGFDPKQVFAVLFSSGSTGRPKGIMLSHYNLFSNIEAVSMLFPPEEGDRICGSLPFFHSFGFTFTLWLPFLLGVPVSYHVNPMETGKIARLIRDRQCTLLFTTPTLMGRILQKADAESLCSLRHCLVGAEKLTPDLARKFEEKFGVQPLEGYGATELSPLVAVNVPDLKTAGGIQIGNKPGTVGHPIPGVAVKIVNPESEKPVGIGERGTLMVRGSNVMLGYLNDVEATTTVLGPEGWYNTEDIASMDVDGFITLHDRLSRFSKIGGEMIPHMAVEQVLLQGLDVAESLLAVIGVPDETRGERLVVVYTDGAGPLERLQSVLKAAELPNLWKPKPDAFVWTEKLPLLGSGKIDLSGIRRLAMGDGIEFRPAGDP